jgi:hypothetical protein
MKDAKSQRKEQGNYVYSVLEYTFLLLVLNKLEDVMDSKDVDINSKLGCSSAIPSCAKCHWGNFQPRFGKFQRV